MRNNPTTNRCRKCNSPSSEFDPKSGLCRPCYEDEHFGLSEQDRSKLAHEIHRLGTLLVERDGHPAKGRWVTSEVDVENVHVALLGSGELRVYVNHTKVVEAADNSITFPAACNSDVLLREALSVLERALVLEELGGTASGS